MARPGYSRAFRATTHVSHAPAEAALARVSTDVLVVMGSKDPDFPDQQAEAELIAERLGGRVAMIPDAGHYPQSEFPGADHAGGPGVRPDGHDRTHGCLGPG